MLKISETARISKLADIEDSTRGTLIEIQDHVIIDSFVKIKPAGGQGDVVIGEGSVLNSGCVIYTGNGVKIGKNVAIAANCTFAPTNHQYKDKNVLIKNQGFMESRGGIVIEDDVWIGSNCILLDGAYLRRGCVIAAGSVVRGETQENGVYAGMPLTKISERS